MIEPFNPAEASAWEEPEARMPRGEAEEANRNGALRKLLRKNSSTMISPKGAKRQAADRDRQAGGGRGARVDVAAADAVPGGSAGASTGGEEKSPSGAALSTMTLRNWMPRSRGTRGVRFAVRSRGITRTPRAARRSPPWSPAARRSSGSRRIPVRTPPSEMREANEDVDADDFEPEDEPVAAISYDDVPTWEDAIACLVRSTGDGRPDRGPRSGPPRRR